MTTHMNERLLGRLRAGELEAEELTATLRHLGNCGACARLTAADADVAPLREVLAEDDSPHLDPERELFAYVRGTLSPADREIAETHLDDCATCRAEVEDLRALQWAERRRRPGNRVRRIALPLAAAVAVALFLVVRGTMPVTAPERPNVVATTPPAPPVTETPPAYANAEWTRLVEEARRTGELPSPPPFAQETEVLRGTGDAPATRLSPSGTYVEETRPRFTWPATRGARYVVSIFAGDEPVAESGELRATEWQPPRSLRRGATYLWQVAVIAEDGTRTILPAPPAPPATFRILSEERHRELAEARRLHPDDALLHRVLEARAGLRPKE